MAETATVTPIRGTRVVVDEDTQQRMRALLEKTRGVVFAPIRKTWSFLRGLFRRATSSAPVRWIVDIAQRGRGLARSLADRLGRGGMIAAAVGTATSNRGQAAIAATGRFLINTTALVADTAMAAVETVLKLVPGPTRWLGVKIGEGRIRFGGGVSNLLTWKGWKKGSELAQPDKPVVRWVNFIARGYFIRRAVSAFVAGFWRSWVLTSTLIGLFAPEQERREIMDLWREQREATRNRKRDAAVWTSPNGVPAEAGKPAVDAAKIAERAYSTIVEKTLEFFAKDGKYPNEGQVAKALYTLVHPQFKELLRSQQAAKAAREYCGLMVTQFQGAEEPFVELGEKGSWNPLLVLELRAQAEAAVGTHNVPAPARA